MAWGAVLGGALSAVGSVMGQKSAQDQANQQMAMQKEFAKSGIQWRVEDARKAGIHPLYALGAQTQSYTPMSVGGTDGGMAAMGQSLSGAVGRASARADRMHLMKMQSLELERAGLENDLLRSQIMSNSQAQMAAAPAIPSPTDRWLIDGQGGGAQAGPLVSDNPMQRVVSDPGRPFSEPGAVADIGYSRTQSGYAPTVSSDLKERQEDDQIGMLMWNARNRLLPEFAGGSHAPPYPAPAGSHWRWDVLRQEYHLVKGDPVPFGRTWLNQRLREWRQ